MRAVTAKFSKIEKAVAVFQLTSYKVAKCGMKKKKSIKVYGVRVYVKQPVAFS